MSSQISISEASRRFNVSRPTIYSKIKTGLLSVTGKGKARKIDVSEMIRVFGDAKTVKEELTTPYSDLQSKITTLTHKIELLELENKHLKERLDREQSLNDDLRKKTPLLSWFKRK